MLLSKINLLAHLRSGTGAELHAAKLQAGKGGNGPAPLGPGRRVGAGWGPGRSGNGRVWRAGKEKEPLEQLYRVGPLLGSGGFGSVYSGVRLSDSAPVAIKHVARDRISSWGELEYVCTARQSGSASTPVHLVALLYDMVCGDIPFECNKDIISRQLFFWHRVSVVCPSSLPRVPAPHPVVFIPARFRQTIPGRHFQPHVAASPSPAPGASRHPPAQPHPGAWQVRAPGGSCQKQQRIPDLSL
ncbi:serine/threonine-protein kinase pim-1-like isoform X3 [Strigops habroptila]|uniref:serine/threonine-protein kinase pim-1-like isoform X3 n=1 Tax=Strigops habroptila TaxID=2489341 RepID=UPI0011D02D9E|nr:serine/threonine-protein kinase pim-1-like isoform X3 [Strigops habroptila]